MKIKKVEKIILFKREIIKIFNYQKKKFNIKEIYLVKTNGIQKRNWRQHNNCKKILFCTNGIFKIEIMQKKKVFKKILKINNIIEIPKKTIFRFQSCSKKENILLVLSEVPNNKLVTKKNFNF
tara:strand:- start:83 stop:451 length:369 start_codon:yes stop_codon:yes gene_type:complete